MSTLKFPDIVSLARNIVEKEKSRGLFDCEVAALQCAWEGIEYQEFINNQQKYVTPYESCYNKPLKCRRLSTISSCSSRFMSIFASHFKIPKVNQSSFKRAVLDLETKGLLNFTSDNSTPISIEVIENNLNLTSKDRHNDIIGRTSDYLNLQSLLKKKTIISLYGQAGVGKTLFIKYFCNQISKEYKCLFTDLRNTDSINNWMSKLLSFYSEYKNLESVNLECELFLKFAQEKTLIVIDSIGVLSGDFVSFLEELSLRKNSIGSSIILISRGKINNDLFASYHLSGLANLDDMNNFFNSFDLKDQNRWQELCALYEGNYRELIYVSKFIRDFYHGNVSDFINLGTSVLSPETKEIYSSIEFSDIDLAIFSLFNHSETVISSNLFTFLRKESSTSESLGRINLLADKGFLIRSEFNNAVSFSLSPLLKQYLIEEKIIVSE